MKKALIALATIATVAAGVVATPDTADAQRRRGGGGGAGVAAGVIGGLAAGAIIGGAIATQPRYYGPGPGYVYYDGYRAPYPATCPGGHWARRPIAFDQWGNPVRWSRARFVCP